ncbi:hypothetical protein E3P99_01572 [Wallemia hederae]|uniref:S-adenosylmethionine decarboxylase proenzyme n=1 Tax=Wallemia hederae TaxID=1540922 RepID=A0A4V6TME5_9BASI|nr:hypothetical protein E3P99_01572 [Wallemia hederae]
MATILHEQDEDTSGPFEGPEKLLEIWFGSHPSQVNGSGLRTVKREIWESMLDLVNCQVLSVIEGDCIDAYLLSESSLFVAPHRLILKTCGTTTLLLGLERILEIAREHCSLQPKQVFYSRKAFMFPERQRGPHRHWQEEVNVLDKHFSNGSAYTVGKMNGDHWLLYMSSQDDEPLSTPPNTSPDTTLEILMTNLHPDNCRSFYLQEAQKSGHEAGKEVSDLLGISTLFPNIALDAFSFTPCGYSSNATWSDADNNDRYFTIHVTPEQGISYASFETNASYASSQELRHLIQRVVDIFNPGKLSSTLFVGMHDGDEIDIRPSNEFSNGLLDGYKRTDRINYEFSGYELAYACYQRS